MLTLSHPPSLQTRGLSAWYGSTPALRGVYLDLPGGGLSVLFGPSGSGKSTLLSCLNGMMQTLRGGRMEGEVLIDHKPLWRKRRELTRTRRRFGVIAQKPNPFPRSIRYNVTYGPKLHRMAKEQSALNALVRQNLERVGLWDEVSSDLDAKATELSVGQQHRLCIARALAYRPEVLLFDEPVATLDPVSAADIENLILCLRGEFTVIVVTHHLDLARRIADHAAFLDRGEVIEAGLGEEILVAPSEPRTLAFLQSFDRQP